MKIALQDKKAVSAFMNQEAYEGRVLISSGGELRGTWGSRPLIARWEGGMIKQAPTSDKGVRRAQELLAQV